MGLSNRLERFFGRFAIPNLALYLIGGQVMFFGFSLLGNFDLGRIILVPADVLAGEFWRLFSFVLVPPVSGQLSLTGALFLAPALIVLGIWIVYPAVYTIIRSFFGQTGYLGTWVGFDNYKRLFTTSTLTTAIKNNAIWVAVVPAFVTAMGLIFAVLTERVRWAVAFKTAVFLPMAISAFATGVIRVALTT